MTIRILLPVLLASVLINFNLNAQPILPQFTVIKLSDDRILIQWKNTDTTLRQISIQQSTDSIQGYRTLLTMPDPTTPDNGTVINRPGAGQLYYRLYLMYPRGRFLFTKARFPTQVQQPSLNAATINQPITAPIPPSPIKKAMPYVPGSSAIANVPTIDHLVKPDSVARITPKINALPTLKPGKGIEVKKQTNLPTEPEQFTPSLTVYTHRDGYVFIQLPVTLNLANTQIRFYTEEGQALFELMNPTLRAFRIDKTNFYRSGWYRFEIWQKGKIIESNRFYVPLEF